jgi:hypothetical protein
MNGTTGGASGQVLGIIECFWNGTSVPIEPGGSFSLGGIRNKSVVAGAQVFNANMMMVSEINVTSVVQAGQNVSDLYGIGQGELQIQCDTGQMFIWPNAFIVDAPDITAGEGGKIKIKWHAGTPQESVGNPP